MTEIPVKGLVNCSAMGADVYLPLAAEGLRDLGGCSVGKERLQPQELLLIHEFGQCRVSFPSAFDGSETARAQKSWDNRWLSRAQGSDLQGWPGDFWGPQTGTGEP